MAARQLHQDMMRSPLGRARGLGAARSGSGHWWATRLTSLALVPLTLWFICAAIRLEGASRADVANWLSHPMIMALAIALIVTTFHHTQSGLQVVIEDYVNNEAVRVGSILLIKGLAFLLAIACIASVLRLGL